MHSKSRINNRSRKQSIGTAGNTKMAALIFSSVAVAVLSMIAYGFYDIMTNFEDNKCEMTYMYEYPEYQKIDMGNAGKDFPSYSLYIYGEGSYANTIKSLKLTGIPALFIPGNAGSHKQVRSLGSVALRMAEHPKVKGHFNYFALDFNEELSGLYGGVLERQTEFTLLCVQKIMTLYTKAKSPPKSVVLIGHSMGGVIARALFTLAGFDHSLVNTIITQATPHQKPVAVLDVHLQNFYTTLNDYWRTHSNSTLQHVTVVSTGGGYRDVQVRYALTSLSGIVADSRAVSASTMSIPKAWASTDHLCSVWCRQMVLLTQRALFDAVDTNTGQISSDPDFRMKVFRHHFLFNNGLSNYLTHDDDKQIILDPKVKWEMVEDRLWKFTAKKMTTATYFAFPVMVEAGNDAILIMSNLSNPDWICYCDIPEGETKCTSCRSLSSRAQLLPPLYSNSKYVKVMHQDIVATNETHIVIMVLAGEKMVNIVTDRYDSNVRHLVYQMPNTYDTIISYPISATDGAAMLKISNGSSFYSLHLAGLSLPTNVYKAIVTPQACRKHSTETYEGTVLRLNIPWSQEDTYTFSHYGKEASIPIKLQTGRPLNYDWRLDASEPHLEMFLHPYCHYQLKLLVATQDSLGQAVRFYGIQFPAYFVAVVLMALRGVIVAQGKGQVTTKLQSPADAILEHGKPYHLVPIVIILRFIISFRPVANLLARIGVPRDDAASLTEQGIYFSLLPLLLYMCAWCVVYLQAVVAFAVLNIISYLGHLFVWIPDSLSRKLCYLRITVSILTLLLTFLCGTLGILCLSAMLILKILQLLYVTGRKLDTKDTHRRLTLMYPILLLVNFQVLLSLGPFVIWLKQVAYTGSWFQHLTSDPSHTPAFITCSSIALLLHAEEVVHTRIHGLVSGLSIQAFATLMILYSMESLYRLPTFISIVALVTSSPSVIGLVAQLLKMERRKTE